jgi:hypothetical protein
MALSSTLNFTKLQVLLCLDQSLSVYNELMVQQFPQKPSLALPLVVFTSTLEDRQRSWASHRSGSSSKLDYVSCLQRQAKDALTLNVSEDAHVLLCDEVDGHTLASESSTSTNSVDVILTV